MKIRWIKESALMLLLVFFLPRLCPSADWHTTVVDTDFEDSWIIYPSVSIQMNGFGYPCISYSSGSSTSELRYAFWDGLSWQKEVVDSTPSGAVGDYCSLALDSNNYPHIAHQYRNFDEGNNYLVYARKVGASWENSTVDSGPYSGRHISLALDSQGYPHISYVDEYLSDHLKYATLTSGGWEIQIVDQGGGYSSIDLDSQDYPHIVYGGYDGQSQLKYARWDGNSWVIQIVDNNLGYSMGSICLDSNDYPSIIYSYDFYDNNASKWDDDLAGLRYAHWNGTQWEIEEIDINQVEPESLSLELDNSGYPHFCSIDGYDCGLEYGFWDGSEWAFHTIIDAEPFGFSYDLALDAQDYPHISYFDIFNDILKYTWYGDPLNAISLLSFTATPQEDSSVLLNWRVETTEGEQVAGFNLYRREINYNNDIAAEVLNLGCIWTRVNNSLITGQNPYAYTDSAVELGKSYEYRLEAVLANESTEILGTASCAPTPPAFAIIKLYPNPATDVLNIALTLAQTGKVTLELYDLTGRVVASQDIQISSAGEFTAQLDVRGLANGVYTLRATQASLSASERVVVVR